MTPSDTVPLNEFQRKIALRIEQLRAALTEASGGFPYNVYLRGIEKGELVISAEVVGLPTDERGAEYHYPLSVEEKMLVRTNGRLGEAP